MQPSRHRPRPVARSRAVVLAASVIFGLAVSLLRHREPTARTALASPALARACRLLAVHAPADCGLPHPRLHPPHPCSWSVRVAPPSATQRRPAPQHPLRLRTPGERPLRAPELAVLRRAAGCRSAAQCAATVRCVRSPEDPSDALLVYEYDHESKFVVLFDAGLASLLFYMCAMIADGALFNPRRQGFAVGSATVLILLALSALLYVLIIPPGLQFTLYGNGALQTFAYICAIILIASILPALAIAWISVLMFLAFVLGFLFEHVLFVLFGTVHFLASLSAYQFSTTMLNLRFVYLREMDDDPEFHRRMLDLSTVFLNRVRNNWFFTRVPRSLGQTAVQLMENSLPEEVFEQIEHDPIPHIDFDTLDLSDSPPLSDRLRQTPPSTPPPQSLQSTAQTSSFPPSPSSTMVRSQSAPIPATDSTPLLQPNSRL